MWIKVLAWNRDLARGLLNSRNPGPIGHFVNVVRVTSRPG